MNLQAPEFFAELGLPFHDSTAVGNTYYATPVPDAPLRLRITFARTISADTYGGLRVAVIHPDRGEVDAVALSFLDHDTFRRRDEAKSGFVHSGEYGTFSKYHRPGQPPWAGAVTTGLRDAIKQYTAVWFPGAWAASAPSHGAGSTAHKMPAPAAAAPAVGRAR
ncbi:hypothetical protein [Streptomyces sp. CAS3]